MCAWDALSKTYSEYFPFLQYVRLADDTPVNQICDILSKEWHQEKPPKLMISIAGGNGQTRLPKFVEIPLETGMEKVKSKPFYFGIFNCQQYSLDTKIYIKVHSLTFGRTLLQYRSAETIFRHLHHLARKNLTGFLSTYSFS